MLARVFILCAFLAVVTLAAEPAKTKPSPCRAGTKYMKDCNVCTCAAPGKKDKCGNIDCSRYQSTTKRTPTGVRPGICPTVVTPAPGSNVCSTRTQRSNCEKDTDCQGAKKCCRNGCGLNLCRNPIYNYTS